MSKVNKFCFVQHALRTRFFCPSHIWWLFSEDFGFVVVMSINVGLLYSYRLSYSAAGCHPWLIIFVTQEHTYSACSLWTRTYWFCNARWSRLSKTITINNSVLIDIILKPITLQTFKHLFVNNDHCNNNFQVFQWVIHF